MNNVNIKTEKDGFAAAKNPRMILIVVDLEKYSEPSSLFDPKKGIKSDVAYITFDPDEYHLFEFIMKIVREPHRKHFDTEKLAATFKRFFEKVLEGKQ